MWRAKTNAVLPVLERLPDGSFRSELVATPDKRTRQPLQGVRVVEYAIDDASGPGAAGTRYRLLTTSTDPASLPADELAVLYAQRWEIESIFDELGTHQRGPRVVLRSRTPGGVYQEAWGYLCVHYAIRSLIHSAARHGDLDPDRISFTKALHATRRSVRTGIDGAVNLPQALRRATAELLHAPTAQAPGCAATLVSCATR